MENKPVISLRDRSLSISVFCREKDGQQTYGACLQRSWKDKTTNEWKREQINLFPDELLKLSALSARTYTETLVYAQNHRQTNNGYPSQSMDDGLNDDIPF